MPAKRFRDIDNSDNAPLSSGLQGPGRVLSARWSVPLARLDARSGSGRKSSASCVSSPQETAAAVSVGRDIGTDVGAAEPGAAHPARQRAAGVRRHRVLVIEQRSGRPPSSRRGRRPPRSASLPTAMPPLRLSPACAAGCSAIQRITSVRSCPRSAGLGPDRRTDPAAATRSHPRPRRSHRGPCRLSSGVQGEWSETMQSMVPSATAAHSSSRLLASRIGGQHLNCVAPSGISSAEKTR